MTQLITVVLIVIILGAAWKLLRAKSARSGRSQYERMKKEKNYAAYKDKHKPARNKTIQKTATVKKSPKLRLIGIALAGALIVFCIVALVQSLHTETESPKPTQVDNQARLPALYQTAGEIIGTHLVENYEGQKALIIMPPEKFSDESDHVALRAIIKTVADKLRIKQFPLQLEGNSDQALAGIWFKPHMLDETIRNHPDFSVVVSIAGLPIRPKELDFWLKKNKPALILMNSPVYRLGGMIKKRYINALLVRRPLISERVAELPPSDKEKWLLLTPENVTEMRKKYEGLMVNSNDE